MYSNFAHVGNTTAFTISEDGYTMYTITQKAYNDAALYKYTMTDPFDIENATLVQTATHAFGYAGTSVTASPRSQSVDAGISALKISPDGTKLYLLDRKYSIITTRISRQGTTNAYENNGNLKATLHQYTLQSAHDITDFTTRPLVSKVLNNIPVHTAGTWPTYAATNAYANNSIQGLDFNSDGSKFYVSTSQGVFEYSSSSYDIS